jgi:23S rRNA (guanine745-N1)-methyltransferase
MSLREQLYDSIHPTPELIKALPEGLNIVNDQTLRYALDLTPADLANLIGMTPHGFRSSPERQRAVIETGLNGLEVAMRLVLLQRC